MAETLEAKEIDIVYDDIPVVKNLTTSIHPKSFIGLIGPNGAGKTSLLRALSGQLYPSKGQILYRGVDIYEHNLEFKRMIGYVHENPFFYPHLTVEEFLYFVARVKRLSNSEIESEIEAVLRSVCLQEEKGKPTTQLSMGMRKKLAVAAALLGDPQIVFLDEALNGIDIESAFHIKKALRDLVENGRTVVLSTHILEVIEKICDRYVILKRGSIIADLHGASLKSSDGSASNVPLEDYVMRLLAES